MSIRLRINLITLFLLASRERDGGLALIRMAEEYTYAMRLFLVFVFSVLCLGHVSAADTVSGKRVLYIGSYHAGNPWSDGITRGLEETLADSGVALKIHRMNTRHNRSEKFKVNAGLEAKNVIDGFKPDVVIVSDDNAVKYVLQAHYRNAGLPFVFCGVNWDATAYGLPYANTTGMVEVALAGELIATLKQYARGARLGYIGLNSLSNRRNIEGHRRSAGVSYAKVYLVDDFEHWKRHYQDLQKQVDMVVLGNHEGMADWNEADAIAVVRKHTQVPSGILTPGRMNLALVGYVRKPEEQGQWAASAALKILAGADPASIPLVRNRQGTLKINEAIRRILGVSLSPALFKRARIIWPYRGRKVFYLSSYLPDKIRWSGEIRRTILKAFEGSGIEFREFFMGAKQNPSEEFAQKQALEAKRLIEEFEPTVVITSDDAAAKYVISPYFRNSDLPFVFTGVNWDASPYGLPTDNVTGMLEVSLVDPLLTQMRRLAKGDRLGVLIEDSVTGNKMVDHHKTVLGIHYEKIYAVKDFAAWKEAYLKLQEEVDMMFVLVPFAIQGWDPDEATAFVEEHIKIPTGGFNFRSMAQNVMGYMRLPEEQGEWAAETALRILDGAVPKAIKMTQNRRGKLLLNRRLINKLGIKLDRSLYRLGEFVE